MATDEDYPIDIPILVIEAQIFVAVKKFPFLPNKLIPTVCPPKNTYTDLNYDLITPAIQGHRV